MKPFSQFSHSQKPWIFVLFVLLACLAQLSFAQSTRSNIAFVNPERIFRESAPAKTAEAKIRAEFSKRDKALETLANELKTASEKLDKENFSLSDTQRLERQRHLSTLDQDFQAKQRAFREDLNRRRNEEQINVLEKGNKAIRDIAEAEGYDMVFQEGVYVNPRIDITDRVLKILNQ